MDVYQLFLIIISIFLSFKAANIRINTNRILLVLFLLFIFHPVIKLLDGQINGLTLFFFIWGIYLICNKGNGWFAGGLFAIAVLIKLQNLLILPFIFLSKKWKVLGGFATGGVIILLLTLLFSRTRSDFFIYFG